MRISWVTEEGRSSNALIDLQSSAVAHGYIIMSDQAGRTNGTCSDIDDKWLIRRQQGFPTIEG
jgi:hypothetical protein